MFLRFVLLCLCITPLLPLSGLDYTALSLHMHFPHPSPPTTTCVITTALRNNHTQRRQSHTEDTILQIQPCIEDTVLQSPTQSYIASLVCPPPCNSEYFGDSVTQPPRIIATNLLTSLPGALLSEMPATSRATGPPRHLAIMLCLIRRERTGSSSCRPYYTLQTLLHQPMECITCHAAVIPP